MHLTPPRARGRLLRAAMAVLTAATVSVGAVLAVPAAAAAPAADDATLDEVYAGLGLYEVHAHYSVLVDTSGSMAAGNLYRYVKDGLDKFVSAVEPSDTISIFSFADETPGACFSGAVIDYVAKCLPKNATGGNTDIGRALEAALDDMKEAKAPVSILLMISDGDHAPPSGSPYGTPSASNPAWAALRKKADALPNLYAYALQLGSSTSARTLKVVFKNTRTLRAQTEDQVRTALDPPKDEVLRNAARKMLSPDMNNTVKLSWDTRTTAINAADGELGIQLTIQSDTEVVPITLSDVTLRQLDGTPLKLEYMPDRIELEPGQPYLALVRVSWPVPGWPRLADEPVNVLARLQLSMTVASRWDAVLADHGLKRETVVEGERDLTISGTGVAGRSIAFFVGVPILLIALVVGLIVVIRRKRREDPAEFMAVTYQRAM